MRFFPYDKYTLKTVLSPTQVSQKIYEQIDSGQMLTIPAFRKKSKNKLEGFVNKREFEINSKRYNFEPSVIVILRGYIDETESGSNISISSYFYFGYYFFLFVVAGYFIAMAIFLSIEAFVYNLLTSFFFILAALAIYSFVTLLFNYNLAR